MITKTINGMKITCESEERAYQIAAEYFDAELVSDLKSVDRKLEKLVSDEEMTIELEDEYEVLFTQKLEILTKMREL